MLTFDASLRAAIGDLDGPAAAGALLRLLGLPSALVQIELSDEGDEFLRELWCTTDRDGFIVYAALLSQPLDRRSLDRLHAIVRGMCGSLPHLTVSMSTMSDDLGFSTAGLGTHSRHAVLKRADLRTIDVELLHEMQARSDESPSAIVVRHMRALDRSWVTNRFFRDFQTERARLAVAWTGLPENAVNERSELALLMLCRLMLLYFLQRSVGLNNDSAYIAGRIGKALKHKRASVYRAVLRPLFFRALNRTPRHRSPAARMLGAVPYLNGGLFDFHSIERKYPHLDLPNDDVVSMVAMFERYRFSGSDHGLGDVATQHSIDPEMLGRVFESLMSKATRAGTGTFFTPADVVNRIVRVALCTHLNRSTDIPVDALERMCAGEPMHVAPPQCQRLASELQHLTTLDPACGSGAFLLGCLGALQRLGDACGTAVDSASVVARSLFGVDVQEDAALLCALRLWIAVVAPSRNVEEISPLPNLDRHIRQGDALIDPLSVVLHDDVRQRGISRYEAPLRAALKIMEPLALQYGTAGPREKPALAARLSDVEKRIAEQWIAWCEALCAHEHGELTALQESTDLFGQQVEMSAATLARRRALEERMRELREARRKLMVNGALPFFSFPVHFGEASARGFYVVLSNPPWVRAHRWTSSQARRVRSQFRVCRELQHDRSGAGGQVDLSMLFLERSIALLRDGGTFGVIMPAKLLRSSYSARARRMLLHDSELAWIEDHSLDQRSIFRADAFASVVVGSKCNNIRDAGSRTQVHVRMLRKRARTLEFTLEQNDLPLDPDAASPWLVVPPEVRRVLRRMQQQPARLHSVLSLVRGHTTNCDNDLLFERVDWKPAGLAVVTPQGRDADLVLESAALAPALRGRDVGAWHFEIQRHVLRPDVELAMAKRAAAYLSSLQRVHGRRDLPACDQAKVVWKDIATKIEAVAIPVDRGGRPIVPLNTLYFAAAPSWNDAHIWAAFLNSLPVRTFAQAIAERAKDSRFRFFAATLGRVPVPVFTNRLRGDLLEIGRAGHNCGTLSGPEQAALDRFVAQAYGLSTSDIDALRDFSNWLSE